jgi:hypothetical protein
MIVVTMPMTLAMKKIVVGCSASYPHAARVVAEAFGVVAEAHGAGRAGGGGGVVCGTLACVLRTSEPAELVLPAYPCGALQEKSQVGMPVKLVLSLCSSFEEGRLRCLLAYAATP